MIKCLKLGSLENLKFEFARAPIPTAIQIWIVKNLHVILKHESGYLHFISYRMGVTLIFTKKIKQNGIKQNKKAIAQITPYQKI